MLNDALIAVGGDGSLFEIFQVIPLRPDAETVLMKLKIGIVGSGTCNGLAKSIQCASLLNEMKNMHAIRESIFLICKGKSSSMALSLFQTLSKKHSNLSFLTFSWVIISDIDFESEIICFIGSLRMELWTVWRIMNFKTHHGKFSYVPPSPSLPSSQQQSNTNSDNIDNLTPEWKTIGDEFTLLWVS